MRTKTNQLQPKLGHTHVVLFVSVEVVNWKKIPPTPADLLCNSFFLFTKAIADPPLAGVGDLGYHA